VGWLRQSHMPEMGTCGLWSQCRQQSWFNCFLSMSQLPRGSHFSVDMHLL
jgi:hypothetical protein